MPTYTYEPLGEQGCSQCHHQFEIEQSIHDQPLDTCPKCHKQVRRVIAGFAVKKITAKQAISDFTSKGFTVLKRQEKGVYKRFSPKTLP